MTGIRICGVGVPSGMVGGGIVGGVVELVSGTDPVGVTVGGLSVGGGVTGVFVTNGV